MRAVALLLLAAAAIWLGFNRERVFLRDPLASVYRNDVKQDGVEVYFNFSNDILLQQRHTDGTISSTIVQHWDKAPGTPASLVCLRWTACLMPADHAPVLPSSPIGKSARDPEAAMDGRSIMWTSSDGAHLKVEL